MSDGITRRQFVVGSLAFSHLLAAAKGGLAEPVHGERYVEVELCLLGFSAILFSFLDDWPDYDMTPELQHHKDVEKAQADFIRGVEVGDVLEIRVADEDDTRDSGIGDTGVSSLLRGGFMERRQVGLLEEVMGEVSRGTSMYAVVKEAFYLPKLDWYRRVWLSVRALETPENRERLRAIRSSEDALARRDKFESDMRSQRFAEALAAGKPLPPL